ncbi:MAG: flagellar hook-basal body complex protein FliE [Hadesarchaea archaeon]|nr:flagellar hook-basal body complex protein FliE [Hadesarchaea archaeon]
MSNLLVIGVVGLQGSGKTEVAKAISQFGIPRVRMGDIVLEEVRKRGLDLNEQTVGAIAEEIRKIEGAAAIAKRCAPLIRSLGRGKKGVVVDGIRSKAEVDEFREIFGKNFLLIAVKANERIRYERVRSRSRIDDATGPESFREKEKRELSWGLKQAMEAADFTLINEGTLEDLQRQVNKILKKIIQV